MDELNLLREFRAELPAPRAETRAAARAGLMARIEHSQQPPRSRTPLWRRPRLRLAVAGIALAALFIALPVGLFGGGGEVQPAVGQVLREVATIAAAQDPVLPGPGQYLYTRSKGAYLQGSAYGPKRSKDGHPCGANHPCEAIGTWSVLVPSEEQTWVSLDGSRKGRVRRVAGKPRFVSADQRAVWVAAGSPPLRTGQVEDSAISGSSPRIDAAGLPTAPAALRHLIEARKIPGVEGPPGEAETFTLIGDMLRASYLPAAVRAALYELTAELPRVELLGEVKDPVGRPGTGIAFTDRKRHTRHELIFDPTTSTLLGERQSIVDAEPYGFKAPPGTPIGYAAYLESKVVDSVGRGAPAGAGGVDNTVACYDRPALAGDVAGLHGRDPIATCAEVWEEGAMDTRRGPSSPPLVACASKHDSGALVFPTADPGVCRRLGLLPFPAK